MHSKKLGQVFLNTRATDMKPISTYPRSIVRITYSLVGMFELPEEKKMKELSQLVSGLR